MPRRLLELFSGTGSMGKAFEELGWKVTSLDVNPKKPVQKFAQTFAAGSPCPRLHQAVRFHLGKPRMHRVQQGLDSPPQTVGRRRPISAENFGDIQELRPKFWALENPATGLLKLRPFMAELPWQDVSYYGHPHRKLTRI